MSETKRFLIPSDIEFVKEQHEAGRTFGEISTMLYGKGIVTVQRGHKINPGFLSMWAKANGYAIDRKALRERKAKDLDKARVKLAEKHAKMKAEREKAFGFVSLDSQKKFRLLDDLTEIASSNLSDSMKERLLQLLTGKLE